MNIKKPKFSIGQEVFAVRCERNGKNEIASLKLMKAKVTELSYSPKSGWRYKIAMIGYMDSYEVYVESQLRARSGDFPFTEVWRRLESVVGGDLGE